MFGEHLKKSRDLMEIHRYQNKFKHKKRTVAEHSWFVSKVAHGLALWEVNKFKNTEVSMEDVLFLAINHDIIEGYTGDIISTTKNYSSVMKEELEKIETLIFENEILKTLPNSWGDMYLNLNKEMSEITSVNAKIVKAADLIDRMYECIEEIELGNVKIFEDILKKDIQKLFDLNLMSSNYFLKYATKDIGMFEYIPLEITMELDQQDFSNFF